MTDAQSTVEWRAIPGFPGYFASRCGQVRSQRCILKQATQPPSGRKKVHICKKNVSVHRLVLLAFVGPCPDGMECCHRDGNPGNNAVENLRWDTRLANAADRDGHGHTFRGDMHPGAVLTEEMVLKVRERLSAGLTHKAIASDIGCSKSTVHRIASGRAWGGVGECTALAAANNSDHIEQVRRGEGISIPPDATVVYAVNYAHGTFTIGFGHKRKETGT